jgi:hypothetical protein
MRRAGRAARVVRRSIALTPFGDDFCRVCLPLGARSREAIDRAALSGTSSQGVAPEPSGGLARPPADPLGPGHPA